MIESQLKKSNGFQTNYINVEVEIIFLIMSYENKVSKENL